VRFRRIDLGAVGMGRMLMLLRIIAPRTLRYALPGMGNVWQQVLKERGLLCRDWEMLDIIQYWWQIQPSAFYVARGRTPEIAGFYCMLKVPPPADGAQFKDSITRTWWQPPAR
jgi:ABC-type arginine/histidine transport system permease subunit